MTDVHPLATPAPGRLSDPTMGPGRDPRTHGTLRRVLIEAELGEALLIEDVELPRDPDGLAEVARESHQWNEDFASTVPLTLPHEEPARVVQESATARADDGREVALEIYRPASFSGTLPGIVYLHGGAMVFAATRNRVHDQWCMDLARQGSVVVQVDFRNAWTPEGFNPFPAGLADCFAALKWTHDHRPELGIGGIIVEGESGGGNLALGTALWAKREGVGSMLAGVYAKAPMISRGYGWDAEKQRRELPSLVENNGFAGMDAWSMAALASIYDDGGRHESDPLAWPYLALESDLAGLPPHVVAVDELDPLRDEGVAYLRRLTNAGVDARGVVSMGLTHCADFTYRQALSSAYRALVRDIVGFASSVSDAG